MVAENLKGKFTQDLTDELVGLLEKYVRDVDIGVVYRHAVGCDGVAILISIRNDVQDNG